MGERKNTIDVQECSYDVLCTIINFMYGIALPEVNSCEDLCTLLAMADLYLMEGLKDAVAPFLAKLLTMNNILEVSTMAEQHAAVKLQELCCHFILSSIGSLGTSLMDALCKAMPFLGQASLRRQAIASKFPNLNNYQMAFFKGRSDFSSDVDYQIYVKANIKPNMIVRYRDCDGDPLLGEALGQVGHADLDNNKVHVRLLVKCGDNRHKRFNVNLSESDLCQLELLTRPL